MSALGTEVIFLCAFATASSRHKHICNVLSALQVGFVSLDPFFVTLFKEILGRENDGGQVTDVRFDIRPLVSASQIHNGLFHTVTNDGNPCNDVALCLSRLQRSYGDKIPDLISDYSLLYKNILDTIAGYEWATWSASDPVRKVIVTFPEPPFGYSAI